MLQKRFVDRALLLIGVGLTTYVVLEAARGYVLQQLSNGLVVRIQVGGSKSSK